MAILIPDRVVDSMQIRQASCIGCRPHLPVPYTENPADMWIVGQAIKIHAYPLLLTAAIPQGVFFGRQRYRASALSTLHQCTRLRAELVRNDQGARDWSDLAVDLLSVARLLIGS